VEYKVLQHPKLNETGKNCYICNNDFLHYVEELVNNPLLHASLRTDKENILYEELRRYIIMNDSLRCYDENGGWPTYQYHHFGNFKPIYEKYEGKRDTNFYFSDYAEPDENGIGDKHFDICNTCFEFGHHHKELFDFLKMREFEEGLFSKTKVTTIDVEHIKKNKKKWKKSIESSWSEALKPHLEIVESYIESKKELQKNIVTLLKNKAIKMPLSDINALLKFGDLDMVKKTCEEMYENGKIDFAGNGRYYVQSAQGAKNKKSTSKKSDTTDVKAELKKYKEMLDEGLIEQEDFNAKKKELLGL